ncbi:sensor histidine kinase [Paenibacillus eucommiae]|uniref:histidine kinase n=1 Tax=Paenibacillus eucommiae TaxID=1355755 RepID=A0ABS4ING4_9BACL|nr:HAMP domain-containing sensor histidine kinase [Paenibacillus eucommiae]MBP1989100.1 signal transduction histidine kinase [Paenibacillus eucommiae]
MQFVLIALWLIAVLLIIIDPRSVMLRWMSAIAFTGGTGALAAVLDSSLVPYLEIMSNQAIVTLTNQVQAVSSVLSYYGVPYSFAMLALQYNTWFHHTRLNKVLPYLLLLPPVLCLLFTPWYTEAYPIDFPVVSLWAIPYIVLGSILIIFKKERLPAMQRTHLFTCLTLIPPLVCFAILNYLLPTLGFYRMWVYNIWSLAVIVPFFVFTFLKYGFFGVRLLIEGRKLDSTLRAITSGTAILNHAIKNDIGKIRLFSEKMNHYAEQTNQPELIEDLKIIASASEHIREMIGRVHEQTQEIPMKLSVVSLKEMLQHLLQQLQPYLHNVEVKLEIPAELHLQCDEAQLKETLSNIIMNAAEAMPQGGLLAIKVFITKKYVVLEIRDTGIGMEKSVLKQSLEPFYTTKTASRNNFGLGLAYCYNVLKKHGGTLELRSEKGKGTSVFLSFPAKLIQKQNYTTEENYESDQIAHRRG